MMAQEDGIGTISATCGGFCGVVIYNDEVNRVAGANCGIGPSVWNACSYRETLRHGAVRHERHTGAGEIYHRSRQYGDVDEAAYR